MRLRPLFVAAIVVAALAFVLLVLSGSGVRLGLWTFRTGFTLIRWAAYAGILGALLAAAALALTRARGRAAALLVVALVAAVTSAALPWSWRRQARSVPPIHDITTDTADPPLFVAVLPLRAGARNPAEYGGDSVATLQRQGYPDLKPFETAAAPGAAYHAALAAARGMGWEVVAADSAAGRVEATATTRWFGFKDDVVVRVRPAAGGAAGSRVDVRSLSRVGGSDVGTNAARIREYLGALKAAL
jgi:uncharacterized protein (DUF1499 family)